MCVRLQCGNWFAWIVSLIISTYAIIFSEKIVAFCTVFVKYTCSVYSCSSSLSSVIGLKKASERKEKLE